MKLFEILSLSIGFVTALTLIIQLYFLHKTLMADHERRRKQATMEYIGRVWRNVRSRVEDRWDDILSKEDIEKINNDPKLRAFIWNTLGEIEHMAVGLNADVYDKDLFYRMTATPLIKIYDKLKPYMDLAQMDNRDAYIEFQELADDFKNRKRRRPDRRANIKHIRRS
jgi:hypothetical protein